MHEFITTKCNECKGELDLLGVELSIKELLNSYSGVEDYHSVVTLRCDDVTQASVWVFLKKYDEGTGYITADYQSIYGRDHKDKYYFYSRLMGKFTLPLNCCKNVVMCLYSRTTPFDAPHKDDPNTVQHYHLKCYHMKEVHKYVNIDKAPTYTFVGLRQKYTKSARKTGEEQN